MGLLTVRDEWTKFIGHRFLNSQICLWLGLFQLAVCIWSIAQHAYSYVFFHEVIHCNFTAGFHPFLGVDVIIYDTGLLHALWGIDGCVAQYMDGGLGRLIWCIVHAFSIIISVPFACVDTPNPKHLWPLLIVQSAYGIGLLILSLSILPRILPILVESRHPPIVAICVYIICFLATLFFLYVYWHWYWHVDANWSTIVKIPFGARLEDANKRSRRDKPRHDPDGPPDPIIQNTPIAPIGAPKGTPCNGKRRRLPALPSSSLKSHRSSLPQQSLPASPESEILPAIWPPPPIIAAPVQSTASEHRRAPHQSPQTSKLPARYHRRQRRNDSQRSFVEEIALRTFENGDCDPSWHSPRTYQSRTLRNSDASSQRMLQQHEFRRHRDSSFSPFSTPQSSRKPVVFGLYQSEL